VPIVEKVFPFPMQIKQPCQTQANMSPPPAQKKNRLTKSRFFHCETDEITCLVFEPVAD